MRRAKLTKLVATEPCELTATVKFTFAGPVTSKQLQSAILRAVNTEQFGIAGSCTVLDIKAA